MAKSERYFRIAAWAWAAAAVCFAASAVFRILGW